jgi:hypothetical protein
MTVTNQNTYMNKLRADETQVMLASIQFRIFCIPVSSINLMVYIYKTIILPVFLCGCDTCFLTLWHEHTEAI